MPEKIALLRQLFLEEKPYEANQALEKMIGEYNRIRSYEYGGALFVELHDDDKCENYHRDLDIVHGVCNVKYEKNGVQYNRTHFASINSGLLCSKYTASQAFCAKISYKRENILENTVTPNMICVVGVTAEGGYHFCVTTKVITDGDSLVDCDKILIKNATYIELFTAICTEFKSKTFVNDSAYMLNKAVTGWNAMLDENINEFTSLMCRSDIVFDDLDLKLEQMPMTERLKRLKQNPNADDIGLISLYWQFGKYLLISSSNPCAQFPANLQGIWANGLKSPWQSDFHTNINIQMNYWQAEQANISECTQPLFRYMKEVLIKGGKKAAQEIYATNGMVVHHLSDIYGYASIADGPWGIWPTGGAWLTYHLWEHYLYTQDKTFLRDVAYEFIRECTVFFVENLFEDKNGRLHIGPSHSPENAFFVEVDGRKEQAYVTISPTMDVAIVGEMFDFYVEMENILGIDLTFAEKVKEKRSRLLPLQIGKHGQIVEWLHDYEETEIGHRHTSPAFALHPGTQINRNTPDLYKAIRTTIERRLEYGGGQLGWAKAWMINFFARLRDGGKTYENIRQLLTESTLPNLLDLYNVVFQIDGNFGGAAGIGESLLQSHEGVVSLLPALSSKLSSGAFYNLRARGGLTVSAKWKKGKVYYLEITPDKPCNVTVEFENGERQFLHLDGTTILNRLI
jgi:alpha-L-fucosidase 2